MSTFISEIIKSKDFIEDHLSQCHGAILPHDEIVRRFVARINAEKPPRPVSERYAAIRMREAGIRNEATLNWFYFFCEEVSDGDFSGMWFRSLENVENPVENPVDEGARKWITPALA